nr:uncharacterized protein LOC127303863 [Lolium perenne]
MVREVSLTVTASAASPTASAAHLEAGDHVFLNEERSRVVLRRNPSDVDATCLGDGSLVAIHGRGTVLFAISGDEHPALTQVYWIPWLKSNIVSISQLDEIGWPTLVKDGFMTVRDRKQRIVARVPRARSRLYIIRLELVKPVCLAAHSTEDAWRWHARFGHLHFDGFARLARQNMVRGLPLIEQVEHVCDACLVGKRHRSPFPQMAMFRAMEPLKMVHGDLCGPVTPATPGGKKYFLLLVDDHSRFMWLVLLQSKDEATQAIRRFQARVERETGKKLRTFRSDRGGEFNSKDFASYLTDLGVQQHLTAPSKALVFFGYEPGSKALVFSGYEPGSKAYRLYDPVGRPVHVSHDVVFDEHRPWNWEGVEETSSDMSFVIGPLSVISGGAFPRAAPTPPANTPAPPSPSSPERSNAPTPPMPASPTPPMPTSGSAGSSCLSEASTSGSQSAGTPVVSGASAPLHPMQTRGRDGIVVPNRRYLEEEPHEPETPLTPQSPEIDDVDEDPDYELHLAFGEEPGSFTEAEEH